MVSNVPESLKNKHVSLASGLNCIGVSHVTVGLQEWSQHPNQQLCTCPLQVIALIAHLVEACSTSGPFMIVVPSSLIANWEQEFQHWAPSLKLVAYKGTADARAALFASQVASFMQG